MKVQNLQEARAAMLVLLRNNAGNTAIKLSKNPQLLEKVIQEYENKGGNRQDIVNAINIGLRRTQTYNADANEDMTFFAVPPQLIGAAASSIKPETITALGGLTSSLGDTIKNLFCWGKCKRRQEELELEKIRAQADVLKAQAQSQAAQAQALALANQRQGQQGQQGQGGSKLPLIIGITLGLIVLIVVTIILIKKKQ